MGVSARTSPLARKPVPQGARQAVFPLSEGDVTKTFPAELSASGLKELGEYLDFLKKQKRDHTAKSQETPYKAEGATQ